jgi:hypothetical protein
VVEPFAVEQPADDLEGLVKASHLLAGGGPVHADRRLIERFAGPDAQGGTARKQLL